ncbi:LysR substrate-binding domain-containing protein [uncultured Shimia sp.]|uniref:LysR substrate-binding domain-containing protein n=1 Tax=uncultured Shimia sp. TaxID=573152 RepID=UPI0026327216|nr:LysR substrate-binding domain-containing protein [uncultured Shimia sp.]
MAKNIDTALLRTFISAIDLGGFHRAATAVHRSQSTISVQLRKLEEVLGVTLFKKSGRMRVLTREGEEFAVYARRLLSLHDQAVDAMSASSTVGFVRIGVMDDYASQILPDIVARYQERHPAVTVEITAGFSNFLMTRLGDDFDLVLSTHPVGMGQGLVLRHERTLWAYAADKPLPDAGEIPLALLPSGNLFRQWALRALESSGASWRIAFTGSSIGTVEAAAAAGIGVTVVKETTANFGLRFLGASDGFPDLPPTEIVLNRVHDGANRAVQAMADQIVSAFDPSS